MVSGVTKDGVTVEKTLPGPSGLTGLILKGKNNRIAIVFASEDGKTLIAGPLFDPNGANLSQKAYNRYLAKSPDPSPRENTSPGEDSVPGTLVQPRTMQLVETDTGYVSQGSGNKTLWIFFDPNCIWCHRLFLMIRDHPVPEGIQIRWVPVGFLKANSMGKAEFILNNGLDALTHDEVVFDRKNEEGGAKTMDNPQLASRIKKNNQILSTIGNGGMETPTILYRDKQTAYVVAGFPEKGEWLKMIGQLSR